MGILFGLTAAFGWGTADFLVRYSTRLIGTYRTLLFMQFFGLAGLTVYLLATGELHTLLTNRSWQPWTWALLAALLSIFSSLALYRSFETGVLMVVSPITSSYAAVTIALAFLSGEVLSQLHFVGVAVVLLGVVLIAISFDPQAVGKKSRAGRLSRGVGLAIIAALGYGITFWVIGFRVTSALGGVAPIWLVRLVTPCVLLLGSPLLGLRLPLPQRRAWFYLIPIGILDTCAFLAYSLGVTRYQVSIVSVISSLYGAVTVLLAWFFLRERLGWSQWLGIAVVFVGIILVNI